MPGAANHGDILEAFFLRSPNGLPHVRFTASLPLRIGLLEGGLDGSLPQGGHRFEWDHKRADGQVFPAEVSLTPFPFGDHFTSVQELRDEIAGMFSIENTVREYEKLFEGIVRS